MDDKSCPYGHGILELAHESERERIYKCHDPECKYTASEKTAIGWALDVAPTALGILELVISIRKGKKSLTK